MRYISRIDIKNNFVIKGIQLEGLRKIGDPLKIANNYYKKGIDEIFFIDCVASLYGRNTIFKTIEDAAKNIFVPLTICGGIKSLKDIEKSLKVGADKVAINSYATENPSFIKKASKYFGSSTIVSSVEAKLISKNKWNIFKHNGREDTNIDLFYWLSKVQDLGCGEIFLTSVDRDGTMKGFDLDLIKKIKKLIKIPIIISGGCGNYEHLKQIKLLKNVDVALGSSLHYNKISINKINR
tara:strand:+ start:52 stop:765 length:714 start_codon:yes stop_codon:yes gene_type:complete